MVNNVLFGNSASLDQAGAIDEELVGALIVFVRRNDVGSLLEAQLHVVGQQNRIPYAVSEPLGTQDNENSSVSSSSELAAVHFSSVPLPSATQHNFSLP